MTDWGEFLKSSAKSIFNGAEKHDSYFETIEIGALKDFGRLEFPAIHIIPDTDRYTDSGEYEESIMVNFYFTKSRKEEKYWDYQEKVGDVVESIQSELEKNSLVIEWKPINFNHYPGTADNKLLHIIEVEWRIKKLQGF